ncbi:hypothetical protein TKK_0005408 [Trichogramma kaykai]|uniref:Uncharacterized protein n=1 Tax=Trichogramma kaykai TaxID=54128 RepID=A0ABD2XIP9_9HYME
MFDDEYDAAILDNLRELDRLKSIRDSIDWNVEHERHGFLWQLYPVIRDWEGPPPLNLNDLLRFDEIERLIRDAIAFADHDREDSIGVQFIRCVARTGYRDVPEINEYDEPENNEHDGPRLKRPTPLHYAVTKGRFNCARELFAIYDRFDLNYTDDSGLTHFYAACVSSHEGAVLRFIELGQSPNYPDNAAGDTLLQTSVKAGRLNIAELLLRRGADPSLTNSEGLTALHTICNRGSNDDFAERFFNICEDMRLWVGINVLDKECNSPLHHAVLSGCKTSARALLRRGADPNIMNSYKLTPLHLICYYDKDGTDMLQLFFECCDQNRVALHYDAQDYQSRTPLHYVVEGHHHRIAMTEMLLRGGADPNYADNEGLTPLHIVCKSDASRSSKKTVDLLKVLFETCDEIGRPVFVNVQDKKGNTPLHFAINRVQPNLIAYLLWRGASPNVTNGEGVTALHYALDRRHDPERDLVGGGDARYRILKSKRLKIIELLIKKGRADPNARSRDRSTPLHLIGARPVDRYGLTHRFFRVCQDTGLELDVNARNERGNTALHVAVNWRNRTTVEYLLAHGADPNYTNGQGSMALHCVAHKRDDNVDLACALYELGECFEQPVRVDARDKFGLTPLHVAVMHGNIGVAEFLLRRGADPNARDLYLLTPLHLMCQFYYDDLKPDVFFAVCDDVGKQVRLDERDKRGWTPLQLAVACLLPSMIGALLDRGADLSGFVFPTEWDFDWYGAAWKTTDKEAKLELSTRVASCIEQLQKGGYELAKSDALTLARYVLKRTLINTDPETGRLENSFDEILEGNHNMSETFYESFESNEKY